MLPTLDQMCKGYGLNGQRMNGGRIKAVLEDCKRSKAINRHLNNGWTKSRQGIGRGIAKIPIDIALNPDSPYRQYFDPSMSANDKKKAMLEFHKKTDYAFLVVDHI